MTIPVVTINSQNYDVYGDVPAADAYLDAASHATSWQAETDQTTKARLLVTATRMLDRQLWKGDKADAAQPLAWPRLNTGITPDPIVDGNGIPVDIINASFELALALMDGSEVQNQQTTRERFRSISAGSVSITNFRGIDDFPTRFPQIVQELLRNYLAGDGSTIMAKATGVDEDTTFPIETGTVGGF